MDVAELEAHVYALRDKLTGALEAAEYPTTVVAGSILVSMGVTLLQQHGVLIKDVESLIAAVYGTEV